MLGFDTILKNLVNVTTKVQIALIYFREAWQLHKVFILELQQTLVYNITLRV
jgi:hypothetical protein